MRPILILGFLTLLLFVPVSNADLLKPQQFVVDQKVGAMSLRAYRHTFKPNESASVHVYGSGSSSLILYVFDADGNCVAWDDNITDSQFCDELAAEWISDLGSPENRQTAKGEAIQVFWLDKYSIEVRNVGLSKHAFSLAVR